MRSLENTLRQYGATADYWVEAARAQADEAPDETGEDVRLSPEFEDLKAFITEDTIYLGLPKPEQSALVIRILDGAMSESKPIYLSLAEIYMERGDTEAASKAYEKCYSSMLDPHAQADPEELRRLGLRLLERCGVDESPLSERDFDVPWVTFSDGDDLSIRHPSDEPEIPLFPEFVEKGRMLNLAVRAFGLVWLYHEGQYDSGISKSDAWGELLSLEGLRAALLAADDLTAVEEACDHFDVWLEDWETAFSTTGLIEPFIVNFRETRGYLKGRRQAARSAPGSHTDIARDLLITRRLLALQINELASELRNKRLTTEEAESLSEAIARKVAEQFESEPTYIAAHYQERLAQELDSQWHELPVDVRRLLIQAEFLRSILHKTVDTDWASVALHYSRAAETFLRYFGRKLDSRGLHRELNSNYPFATARIEHFRNNFLKAESRAKMASAVGLSEGALAELGRDLDRFVRDYRTPSVHGAEPMAALKVMELRELLFAQGGLLQKIASLCGGDHVGDGSA